MNFTQSFRLSCFWLRCASLVAGMCGTAAVVFAQPATPVPKAAMTPANETILDRDREFEFDSKIPMPAALSPVQVENLALLGRVWGFLKYHHPKVTSGLWQWDFELFRILPKVLAAPDAPAGRALMLAWIGTLGELSPPASRLPTTGKLVFGPDHRWIDDARLGAPLAARLRAVYAARSSYGQQFFVASRPNGNPDFSRELAYPGIQPTDFGYRLLTVFRYWNIIQYWFPYRDVIDEDWDQALSAFIPRVALARTPAEAGREMIALVAKISDTHAFLAGPHVARPPVGPALVPVVLRFVGDQAVVAGLIATKTETPNALQRGDVLLSIDGRKVPDLVREWSPYYSASNEAARLRDIARSMTNGQPGPVTLTVRRGTEIEITANRVLRTEFIAPPPLTHDRPGPAFQLLSKDIAYLKLSGVKGLSAADLVNQAAGTKGWIIDIRNYPGEFVVYKLGNLLVDKPSPFALLTAGTPIEPGAFYLGNTLSLSPGAPRYQGKIAILVDEVSVSQSEFTAMAFRTAPGAVVIGSTTAGADGDVSPIPLPGNLRSAISGLGIFYPDGRPTQRIGIIPDIEVRPTIAGLREGRDEVLEAAIRHLSNKEPEAKSKP